MAIPDVDIHPSATGRAAEIVQQHENADADLVLYSGWFCVGAPSPCTQDIAD